MDEFDSHVPGRIFAGEKSYLLRRLRQTPSLGENLSRTSTSAIM